MPTSSRVVAVTAAATRLDIDDADYAGTVVVANRGATALFLGASDVTTATGYQLDVNASVTLPLTIGVSVYAVAATTGTAHVLQVG